MQSKSFCFAVLSQADPSIPIVQQNNAKEQQQQQVSPPLETSQPQAESSPMDPGGAEAIAAAHQQIHKTRKKTVPSQQETMPPKQDEMPLQQEIMKSQQEIMKSQQETMPLQHDKVPSQQTTMPLQQETVPLQQETMPSQQDVIPSYQVEMRSQQKSLFSQQETMPSQQETMLSHQGTMLSQQEAMPPQQETMFLQQKTMFSQQEEMPSQPELMPSQQETMLSQQGTVHSQQETMLSQQEAMSSQYGTLPSQQDVIPSYQVEMRSQQQSLFSQQEFMPSQQTTMLTQQEGMQSPQEVMPSQQKTVLSQQDETPSHQEAMLSQQESIPSQQVTLSQSVERNRSFELEAHRLHKLLYSRNKNILTLGGSTTWGSKLDSRFSAYPYLIPTLLGPTWRSYNLAVRATDASYASQCIESMIREGVKNAEDIEFDIILLEYSLNGLDGMPLLLQRLRRRFPKAIIIYVHLWSLRMSVDDAVTGAKPRDELSRGLPFKEADVNINNMLADPTAKWVWAPLMKQDSEDIARSAEQQMNAVGGHIYQVPMPESLQITFDEHWFGPDYHHLSSQGHAMVANHLAKMLRDESIVGSPKRFDIHGIPLAPDEGIGSWGEGDQCYSWYETGTHPDIRVDGGTVKNFVKNDKWAVSVGLTFGQPSNIWFPNRKSSWQPVMLMIMSWGPGVYPKSRIDLLSPGFENQSSMLDPLHPNPLNHVFHVTRTAHVGWANFGESRLTVDPIEDMQRPFRVIGIVMCGACMEMDETYMSNDATHQRLGGTLPPPVPLPESPEMEEEHQVSPDYQYYPIVPSQIHQEYQSGVNEQQEGSPGAIGAYSESGMTTLQRPIPRVDYVHADQQTSSQEAPRYESTQ
jgi:hypothetical protein